MHLLEQQEMMKKASDFDVREITLKFANQNSIDVAEAVSLEVELKRFLCLSIALRHKYAISGKCDLLWHALIIHTETYQKFCTEVFGHFIHHRPREKETGVNDVRYFRFLVDYYRYFNEIPPASVWPLSDLLFGEKPVFDPEAECIAPCAEV